MASVLDNIPVINTEQTDPLTRAQDVQNTTVESSIRWLIADMHTPDTFKNVKGWQGIVMREINEKNQFEYSTRAEIKNISNKNLPPIKYKVYVMGGPGSIFEKPKTYDLLDEDKRLINALDDYSLSPAYSSTPPKVGSIVWITNNSYQDKVIEYTFSETIDVSIANNEASSAKSAISGRAEKLGGPVIIGKIPDDIVEGEQYIKGSFIKRIPLKTIVSYHSARMWVEAADKFNALCEEAAKTNIRIVASSGFRDQQLQISLYNDRYVSKYFTGMKYEQHLLMKADFKKREVDPLTPNGQNIGVAAFPGFSNHQNGTAVDIDVGVHKAEKNRYEGDMGKHPAYRWMVENAVKFGFDNIEGSGVNEPWHWVYKSIIPANPTVAQEQKDEGK
jgi:LAS superfamily LD-carboxypeptidase LdcB